MSCVQHARAKIQQNTHKFHLDSGRRKKSTSNIETEPSKIDSKAYRTREIGETNAEQKFVVIEMTFSKCVILSNTDFHYC